MSSDPTANLAMANHEATTLITDTEVAKPEVSRQSSLTASLDNIVQQSDEVGPQEKGVATADSDHARAGPTKIPRSRRRGLLASWSLVPEVTDPKEYPRRTKWFITFVIAAAAIAAPMGSAIFFRKHQLNHHEIHLLTLQQRLCPNSRGISILAPPSPIFLSPSTCSLFQSARSGGLPSPKRSVVGPST